ncbi:MAG: hypothetical protein AVDCRST_MAG31-1237, partial [uncultured Sphingomonas sp.]
CTRKNCRRLPLPPCPSSLGRSLPSVSGGTSPPENRTRRWRASCCGRWRRPGRKGRH